MLAEGDKAPALELPSAEMEMQTLSQHEGANNIVLYFYPKDDTPGCTKEGLEFTDLMDEFAELDTVVIGVSKDSCISHAAFRDKYGLTIQLLADVEGQACEAFGVWQEKEKHGEKKMGIVRSTFIIDKQGTIRHAIYGVSPGGHAEEVLDLVKAL